MKNTRTIVRVLIWDCPATVSRSVKVRAASTGFASAFRFAGQALGARSARCGAMTPGLLIVGGGLAAQRCCETLRALGHDGPITIVGPERPYDRPPLSKEAVAEPPWLRPLDWYAAHDVTLRTGVAVRLDAGRRVLALADGERLRYDDLLIATGSEPVRLPALDGFENVQALRTFEDAARLRAAHGGRRAAERRRRRADRARGRVARAPSGRGGDGDRGGAGVGAAAGFFGRVPLGRAAPGGRRGAPCRRGPCRGAWGNGGH